MRQFAISCLIGTALYVFGKAFEFTFTEIMVMCVLGGIIQGTIAAMLKETYKTLPAPPTVAVGDTMDVNGIAYTVIAINEDGIVVKRLS